MIGHQAIGQQVHRVPPNALAQHSLEGVIVVLRVEEPHTAIPALEHVVDHPCFDRSSGSGHPPRINRRPPNINVSDDPFYFPRRRDQNRRVLSVLLRQVRVWPLNPAIAPLYAEIYLDLRARGRVLSQADVLLVALALR